MGETDTISRQAAIDALARMMPRSYTPDGSHPADEEIFRAQEVFADCIEALEILPSAQPATNCSEIPNGSDDTISRRAAIDALWKALYEYEDETEKQFLESEELDVGEWIGHRIFVQNMNDIDRQTILNLPSAQPEIIRCKECKYHTYDNIYGFHWCNRMLGTFRVGLEDYCSFAKRRTDERFN